jgi:hypothetical protein
VFVVVSLIRKKKFAVKLNKEGNWAVDHMTVCTI